MVSMAKKDNKYAKANVKKTTKKFLLGLRKKYKKEKINSGPNAE